MRLRLRTAPVLLRSQSFVVVPFVFGPVEDGICCGTTVPLRSTQRSNLAGGVRKRICDAPQAEAAYRQ